MVLGLLIGTIADNQQFQRVMRAGFRIRAVLIAELHRKILYLCPTDRAKFSSGRVFNFVASDSETLQILSQNLLNFISAPARIIGAMVMLYSQLGLASLVSPAALIVMVPVQGVIARVSAVYMKRALAFTDERAKLEGELMAGECDEEKLRLGSAAHSAGAFGVQNSLSLWDLAFILFCI